MIKGRKSLLKTSGFVTLSYSPDSPTRSTSCCPRVLEGIKRGRWRGSLRQVEYSSARWPLSLPWQSWGRSEAVLGGRSFCAAAIMVPFPDRRRHLVAERPTSNVVPRRAASPRGSSDPFTMRDAAIIEINVHCWTNQFKVKTTELISKYFYIIDIVLLMLQY